MAATSFKVPASPRISIYKNESFLGCDFTSDASTVDDTKSPNCVNMIRSVPGKVRKRMGYRKVASYNGQCIYGVHHLSTTDIWLVHAGTKIYNLSAPMGGDWVEHSNNEIVDYDTNNIVFLDGDPESTLMYTGMAEHRSISFEIGLKLVILDGTYMHIYDGTTFAKASANAYIPTLFISEEPQGGSTEDIFEARNLIQPAWKESYYVSSEQASTKEFQLSFGNLDATAVKAWVMDGNGEMQPKTEGTHFSVNRSTGKVTFVTAPGASPVSGADNVIIQAYKTVPGYADRINHCTIGALFGVNGASDRLFVSGNPDKGYDDDGNLYTNINRDWYSGQYDPTYYADTSYSQLGSDASAIMGYSIINNYLATHKDYNELSQSVLIREGDLVDGKPSFKLINALQGAGAYSKYCFAYLEEEPLFLTKLGVYAITAQDITGEKYAQNRSYYLDGKLLEEENLENAFAYTYRDYYLLSLNNHVYVLDGLQPIRTDKSKPYATRQYVGFYWDDIPAACFFEMNGNLCFGTTDGYICKFYTNRKELESYSDFCIEDGEESKKEIPCVWETADICESLFYKNKKYRYIAIKSMPELSSSVQIWAQRHGIWEMLKEDEGTLRYFDFRLIDFTRFSFNVDQTAKVISTKARLRKLDHVRFRFINEKLEQPFSINDFAVEYTQNGNHKG